MWKQKAISKEFVKVFQFKVFHYQTDKLARTVEGTERLGITYQCRVENAAVASYGAMKQRIRTATAVMYNVLMRKKTFIEHVLQKVIEITTRSRQAGLTATSYGILYVMGDS